jgi:hypothetical protein
MGSSLIGRLSENKLLVAVTSKKRQADRSYPAANHSGLEAGDFAWFHRHID